MALKKVLLAIKNLILALLTMVGLVLVIISLPKTSPIKGFVVTSGSMRPSIWEGSVVFVQRGNRDIAKNDVITFLNPANPKENITHRVTDIEDKNNQRYFITKGDANNTVDLWKVRKESVWGKVRFSIPLLGFIISFSKTKIGSIIIFVIPAVLIILSEAVAIFSELKKIKSKSKNKAITAPIIALWLFYGLTNHSSKFTAGDFLAMSSSDNNKISTVCWADPSVPNLLFPANNSIIGSGSPWDLNPFMDWEDSTSTCPLSTTITYQYESYSDAGLTNRLYQSSWLSSSQIPAPGTPDGTYYWRVRARDNHGNVSDFSTAWKVVIDRVAPSLPSLSITGSYTKSVEERINSSNWTSVGSVAAMANDTIADPATTINSLSGTMFRIGDVDNPGSFAWDNRLMQSFATGAKSLSLHYNFFSRDYAPFDDPGFYVRLGGQEVFRLSSLAVNPLSEADGQARSTDWQEFYYDLSPQSNTDTNLALYSGNTGSDGFQSWTYIDKVTTYFVSAPLHATYSLAGSDVGSGLSHFEYELNAGGWTSLSLGSTFTVPTGGSHLLTYRSVDGAGNKSATSAVRVIVDDSAPSAITDLVQSSVSANTAILTWTAPGNDGTTGRSATYDLRYSTSPIDSSNFDSATKVGSLPSPNTSGSAEEFQITGLNPSTTYYFALKSADEAPNWSDISNVLTVSTSAGMTLNRGDIVVNEVFWIEGSNPEQLIELRNTTNRSFADLSGLTLQLNGSPVIDFSGKSISPNGYLLVSTLNNSTTNNKSIIDVEDAIFNLSRTSLDLVLDYSGNQIDIVWDITNPVTEGLVDTTSGSEKYYSMERTSSPGEGDQALSWYTCIDIASSIDFFKSVVGVDFRGTPRSENRSENEPFSRLTLPRSTPTPTTSPTPTPAPLQATLGPIDSDNKINLTISGTSLPASYEVKYTNSIGEQGFAGNIDLATLVDNTFQHSFYLGTCSASVCTPDLTVGTSATVILSGNGIDFQQTFTIK